MNYAQKWLCWQKAVEKKLRGRRGYEIHVETISVSTDFVDHTHRETTCISTRNSICRLILWFFFIKATEAYLLLYVSILWSDLQRPRICPLEQNTDTSFWSSIQCLTPLHTVSEEKVFKHCTWRRRRQQQRRRAPEQCYTISSPYEPDGSGELKTQA